MGQQQLLLIILGVIIVGIAIAVGLSLFSAQSIQANKDAIINDINNIAANAYQFRIRPVSMNGGGGAYDGNGKTYTIPVKMASNDNAKYTTPSVSATEVTIRGENLTNPSTQFVQAVLDSNGKLTPGGWSYGSDFQ